MLYDVMNGGLSACPTDPPSLASDSSFFPQVKDAETDNLTNGFAKTQILRVTSQRI